MGGDSSRENPQRLANLDLSRLLDEFASDATVTIETATPLAGFRPCPMPPPWNDRGVCCVFYLSVERFCSRLPTQFSWRVALDLQRVRRIERYIVVGSRFLTLPAVVGSLLGSILMFYQGLYNIYEAYALVWTGAQADVPVPQGTASVISVIESLDRFLIAIVLLYFAYGVYSLFIHPEEEETELALPAWLRVGQIGQLKQVVAEVIIVVLLVLFLRVALEAFQGPRVEMSWQQIAAFVLLPTCTALLALSLRLVQLHPKPPRRHPEAGTKPIDGSRKLESQRLEDPD
jgi:uncharacterized membrane protein YqhA